MQEHIPDFSNICVSFAQPDAITQYRVFILKAMRIGLLKDFKVGLGKGLTFCVSFFTFAFGFWYATKMIADQADKVCFYPSAWKCFKMLTPLRNVCINMIIKI